MKKTVADIVQQFEDRTEFAWQRDSIVKVQLSERRYAIGFLFTAEDTLHGIQSNSVTLATDPVDWKTATEAYILICKQMIPDKPTTKIPNSSPLDKSDK